MNQFNNFKNQIDEFHKIATLKPNCYFAIFPDDSKIKEQYIRFIMLEIKLDKYKKDPIKYSKMFYQNNIQLDLYIVEEKDNILFYSDIKTYLLENKFISE